MSTPTDHAQLYRELADELHKHTCLYEGYEHDLATRAHQAADEIEGRRVPSDEELRDCYDRAADSFLDGRELGELDEQDFRGAQACGLRAVARFGGGEIEGRRVPTSDDLMQILFDSFRGPIEFVCDTQEEGELMAKSHVKFALAMLARFGGGEIERGGITISTTISDDFKAELKGMCEEVVARQAADEIEGQRVTPKQLKELANLIGNAEPDTDHDCLGIALATYFESSRHRPDGDPPCDEDGLDGWTRWVMVKTNEMLLEAAKSVLARFGGGEVK